MYLVRIGYRTVNLEYLIETADSELGAPPGDAPPGGVRVSVYPGRLIDAHGVDAARLRRHLVENLRPPAEAEAAAEGDRDQTAVRPRGRRSRPVPSPKSSSHEE